MLRRRLERGSERGASLLIALGLTVAILGFGAVAVRIATDDLSASHRQVNRSRAELNAELGASEAVARIVDGATTDFKGTGVAGGDTYQFGGAVQRDGSWLVSGSAGDRPDVREVVVAVEKSVATSPAPTQAYAIWAGKIASTASVGTIAGAIGASGGISFPDVSFGTVQHLLTGATCSGCSAPQTVSSHVATPLPSAVGAKPCPGKEITGTIAAGVYLCDFAEKLVFSGATTVAGPVEIHLGPRTQLSLVNSRINVGGAIDDFIIVQPTASGDGANALIEGSSLVGRLLMPATSLLMKTTVEWNGSIEVGSVTMQEAKVLGQAPPSVVGDRYAVWAESLLSVGWVRSGDVAGPVGSRLAVNFLYSHGVGSSQEVVAGGRCINCSAPVTITDYELLSRPSSVGSARCPVDLTYAIGTARLGGSYLCDRSGATLRITGEIIVTSPTVIHVGADTRIDIRDATINLNGDSANFLIVQESVTKFASESVIDNTIIHGRVLTPTSWWWVGDVTFRGTFEVGTWWLYDWANIDGAWDGSTDTGPGGATWQITSWVPS